VLNCPEPVKLTLARLDGYRPQSDQIMFKSGNVIQRICFYVEPVEWDAIETEHLAGFRQYIKTLGESQIPDYVPEEELVRALHAAAFDYKLTYTEILAQIQWRKQHLPIHLQTDELKLLVSNCYP
jgi:hypothetical protein